MNSSKPLLRLTSVLTKHILTKYTWLYECHISQQCIVLICRNYLLTCSQALALIRSEVPSVSSQLVAKVPGWHQNINFYFAPSSGARYCNQHVCMSVCGFVSLSAHISKTTRLNFMIHSVCASLWPLWWQCNTLCTSGFVDDVMFSHNGPNKDTRLKSGI